MEKPLTSKYKGLLTASYQTPLGLWQFDVTLQLNGGGQLLSDFPADVPFLGNLSGQRRGGEHDCPAILHFNADDHVAGNGTCFRNTDSIVAVR